MADFKFKLGQKVRMKDRDVIGIIVGRLEKTYRDRHYYIMRSYIIDPYPRGSQWSGVEESNIELIKEIDDLS